MFELANPCPLCGDRRVEVVLKGTDLLHGTPGEFKMHSCVSCGLWRLGNIEEEKPIETIYPPEYTPYQDKRPILPVQKPSLTHQLRKEYIQWIERDKKSGFSFGTLAARLFSLTGYFRFNPFSYLVSDKKILDIGCADGHFLAEMAQLGWKPYGIEQDKTAAQRAGERGAEIFCGDFLQVQKKCVQKGPYDLITLRQVLEHFDDPFTVLRKVYDLIVPGGFVAIWVPVRDGLAPKIFKRFWYNLDFPRHRVIFARKTLSSVVRQAGFKQAGIYGCSSARSITGSLANRHRALSKTTGYTEAPVVKRLSTLLTKGFDLIGKGDNVLVIARKPK